MDTKLVMVVIPVDESVPVEVVEIKASEALGYAQGRVVGYIERVPTIPGSDSHKSDMDVYVNEEGLLKGLPFNNRASKLAGQHLVGPAVVIDKPNAEGDWTSLIPLQVEAVLAIK